MAQLARTCVLGVPLLRDPKLSGGVSFAFTGREGGVSEGKFASLNLSDRLGDAPAAVAENRRRALAALGAEADIARLICPKQVHGSHIVCLREPGQAAWERAAADAAAGADAVVVSVPHVPVLLCFADCVSCVLVAPDGFAIAHSGWRGTRARIAALTLEALCEQTGASPAEVRCYLGPAITGEDYEVSPELLADFVQEFGPSVRAGEHKLSLQAAIRVALEQAGLPPEQLVDAHISTASHSDQYFSWRASAGECGRHGALAIMDER